MTDRGPSTWTLVGTIIGAMAFTTGLTKGWIIDPLASAFDSLSPDGKVIVVAVLVAATTLMVSLGRIRRRRTIDAASAAIAAHDRT